MTTPLAKAALIERRGELFDATAGKRHYQDLEAYGERVASRAHRTRG